MTKPKRSRPLTADELEVVRLVALGWTNEQIARQLKLALPTLRQRLSTLYHLVDVAVEGSDRNGAQGVSRARLTIWAYERGLVGTPERLTRREQLAEEAFAVCRGLVLKRPVPVLREQAVRVIRETDAELMADVAPRAA